MVDVLDTDVSMLRHEEVIVGTETVETSISDSITSSYDVVSDHIADQMTLTEEAVVAMVSSAVNTTVSVPAVDTTVSLRAVDTTAFLPTVGTTAPLPAVDTMAPLPAVDTTVPLPAVDTTALLPAVDTTVSVLTADTTVSVAVVTTTTAAAAVVSESTISDTVVTTMAAPPLIKTVMVAPPIGSKGVMTLKEATTTTNSQTLKRPIYLIPNSSGSLTMTTVAPVAARTPTGEGFVNKVVFATTAPLASSSATAASMAGLKVQPGRSLTTTATPPTLVKGNTVTTTSAGSPSPLITKVIITNNPLSGQATATSLAPGQNAILAGLQQPVKIVTAAQAQALVGQNKTMTLTQAGLAAPLKQQIFTAVPGTPPKHSTFMLGKIALSPKTPTTITMIPVTMGKSPQKIAPAPIGTTAQLVSKGTVLSVVSTASTTSAIPKFSTIASSPSKFIIKQGGSTLSLKPGVVATVSAATAATLNTAGIATGATIKHITIPTSAVSSGGIHVPGNNKFSYIRLVATPSSAGTTTSSGVKTIMAPVVASASKPIVPVTVSTIASTSTLGQHRPPTSLQTIGTSSSQLKIAVPIAPAIAGQQLKSIGGQQRFLIPASAVSSIGQLRQGSGSITVPANALASLPPGTTLFSPGGNIMMVPAQYVAQFQQPVVSQSGQTTIAASTSLFAASRVTTTASSATTTTTSSSSVTSAPSTFISTSTRLPVTTSSSSFSSLAVPVSSISHERGHLISSSSSSGSSSSVSKHQLNGFVSENRDQRMVNKKELVAHDFVPRRKSGLEPNGVRPRKPCNCTKSQCLKLYCDCFANGEFCYNCNCNCCFNNLEHEEDRQKAIKSCLERNPNAFHPKIGKSRDGEIERRHNKGCNCKRSGCLKNYCECYEAKIMCSHICKCVGCKNFAESADKKTLMHLADAAEVRVQQQTAAKNKLSSQMQDVSNKSNLGFGSGERMFSSFITSEVVEATCQCLLAQAEEGRKQSQTEASVEQLVVQEFGRCLQQIIEYASKTKV